MGFHGIIADANDIFNEIDDEEKKYGPIEHIKKSAPAKFDELRGKFLGRIRKTLDDGWALAGDGEIKKTDQQANMLAETIVKLREMELRF